MKDQENSKRKEDYLKKKEKEKKKNRNEDDYYKRAMKYNGENYVEGEEDMYNIEEQRKRLEEFERRKINKDKMKIMIFIVMKKLIIQRKICLG